MECGCISLRSYLTQSLIEATRFMNCPISLYIRMNIRYGYVWDSIERGVASRVYGCGYVTPLTQGGMGEQCTHCSFGEKLMLKMVCFVIFINNI